MQTVHTAGLPPNQGRIDLLSSGWTWNSRKALKNVVRANMMQQFAAQPFVVPSRRLTEPSKATARQRPYRLSGLCVPLGCDAAHQRPTCREVRHQGIGRGAVCQNAESGGTSLSHRSLLTRSKLSDGSVQLKLSDVVVRHDSQIFATGLSKSLQRLQCFQRQQPMSLWEPLLVGIQRPRARRPRK